MIGFVSSHSIFRFQFVRFVISGSVATLCNLAIMFVCTDYFGVYYLYSSIIAFCCAFVVSFSLQKLWTFEEYSMNLVHQQFLVALFAAVTNLFLNTMMLYILVEYARVHYLLAQVIASAIIAIETFFLFRYVIFRHPIPVNPNGV